jgi:glutathione peroxidase
MPDLYTIPMTTLAGQPTTLETYRGQVLLIVNVAGKCGFTGQYDGLEALYKKYKDQGFVVLGFPCNQFLGQEPGNADEIQQFCSTTYQVSFPMFAKIEVNGANTHPLYAHLKAARRGLLGTTSIKWNFTKFLVNRQGEVVSRVSALTKPAALESQIEKLLNATV